MKPALPGTASSQPTNKELAMYIGLGTVVLIVIIVLAVMFLRRA
jgi:Tfp pilus assembly protein PilN